MSSAAASSGLSLGDSEGWAGRSIRLITYLWVVFIVLALTPYTNDPAGPIKHLISDLALVALAAIFLGGTLAGAFQWHWRSPVVLAVSVWLLINIVAALAGPYPGNSLAQIRDWLSPALAALIAAQAFQDPRHAWRLLMTIAAAVAVSSAYGFLQAWGLDPFPWSQRDMEEYRALPSTFANPNFAGHALVLAIVAAAGAFMRVRSWLALMLLAPMLVHLYLTDMRGGPLAVATAAVFALLFGLLRRFQIRDRFAAVGALLILIMFSLMGVCAGWVVLERHEGPMPLDSSLVLRLNGYFGAAELIHDRPLLGHGPGNYARFNATVWTPYEADWFATEGKKNFHVHNDLLEAGVEAGLPGMAAYLLLFAAGMIAALTIGGDRDRRVLGGTLAAMLLAFATDGLFGFNLRVPVSGAFFFLMLGLVHAQWPRPVNRAHRARLSAAALLCVSLLILYVGVRAFRAEGNYQRGIGALAYAETQHADPARQGAALNAAYEAFTSGAAGLPNDPRFEERAGAVAMRQRRYEIAREHLLASLALHPAQPRALTAVGETLVAELRGGAKAALIEANEAESVLDPAAGYAQRALSLSPRLPEAHMLLGFVRFVQAGLQERSGANAAALWRDAADHYEAALASGVQSRALAQRELAKALVQTGDFAGAARALRSSAELDPGNPEVWELLEALADEMGDTQVYLEALSSTWARLQQERHPAGPRIALRLARAQGDRGQRGLDATLLQSAIELYPAEPSLWGELIVVSAHTDPIEALRALTSQSGSQHPAAVTRFLAVTGDTAEARAKRLVHVAELLIAAERWAEAEPVLVEAIPGLPHALRAGALEGLSQVLAKLGRVPEALSHAREAVTLSGGSLSAQWNLARRLADAGRVAEARFAYETLKRRMNPADPAMAVITREETALNSEEGAE